MTPRRQDSGTPPASRSDFALPETDAFAFALGGLSVRVHGVRHAVAEIDRLLAPWCPRTSRDAVPHLDFSFADAAQPGHVQVRLGGKLIATSEAMPYLFTVIQQAVDEAFVDQLTPQAAIHAGVVAFANRAIILPGPSGTGKTSLVEELVRQGAEYCSDEYAIVDSAGFVYPYPRPLMIRDDTGEQYPTLPAGTVRACPAPAGLILFLAFEQGQPFETTPLSCSEALLRLLQNTPHVLAQSPHILAPLRAACDSAGVLRHGRRGDKTEAAGVILQLAASLP